MPYRYLEHTADIGIIATGSSQAEVFAAAADALSSLLCDKSNVVERESMEITATSSDLEALMVEWLNEINFVFETEHFAFGRFEIREISETRVSAVAFGEPLDPERHLVGEQVKAATYHNLSVTKMPSGKWAARVVLDI